MGNKYFTKETQLEDWTEAAFSINERFGIEKALGYLIGEKFYNIAQDKQFAKRTIRKIEDQRNKPDYNPIRKSSNDEIEDVNLDEEYEKQKERISTVDDILDKFARLIKESFDFYEIKAFLKSNPRLGALGHICSEEQHAFFIENKVVERSIDTEIEDALIFGEMTKYFEL